MYASKRVEWRSSRYTAPVWLISHRISSRCKFVFANPWVYVGIHDNYHKWSPVPGFFVLSKCRVCLVRRVADGWVMTCVGCHGHRPSHLTPLTYSLWWSTKTTLRPIKKVVSRHLFSFFFFKIGYVTKSLFLLDIFLYISDFCIFFSFQSKS